VQSGIRRNRRLFGQAFLLLAWRETKSPVEKGRWLVPKSKNGNWMEYYSSVFDLILTAAVTHRIPQEEMPATLYIISDMEFNYCVTNAGLTNFENAKRKYAHFGYKLPNVVFWNVQSRNRQQPVTMNEQGVALISGCTPRLFSMVASGNIDPYSVMMDVIGSERYAKISA
jgi:hypothetical protein